MTSRRTKRWWRNRKRNKRKKMESPATTTTGSFTTIGNQQVAGLKALPQQRRWRWKRRGGTSGLADVTAPVGACDGEDGSRLITVVRLREAIVHKPDDPSKNARLGEATVHRYFVEQLGSSNVQWVNQDSESGLPYDIIITKGDTTEYVEVKATMVPNKYWFHIQPGEWQFASEKGDSLSIAHVSFSGPDKATITILRDPYRLCKRRNLSLTLVMSKEFEEVVAENMNRISVVLKPGST